MMAALMAFQWPRQPNEVKNIIQCSGYENALLYDSLFSNNVEHSFERCLGRLNAWDFTAAILAAFSGSLMAVWFEFELNYRVSFTAMFVSLFISLMLVEPESKRRPMNQLQSKNM